MGEILGVKSSLPKVTPAKPELGKAHISAQTPPALNNKRSKSKKAQQKRHSKKGKTNTAKQKKQNKQANNAKQEKKQKQGKTNTQKNNTTKAKQTRQNRQVNKGKMNIPTQAVRHNDFSKHHLKGTKKAS